MINWTARWNHVLETEMGRKRVLFRGMEESFLGLSWDLKVDRESLLEGQDQGCRQPVPSWLFRNHCQCVINRREAAGRVERGEAQR